jgi:hypothetical protein
LKSVESFLARDNQTKRGQKVKQSTAKAKRSKKGTNQRWLPPIQRRDVEVTLDSNMQETKPLLGRKHPAILAGWPSRPPKPDEETEEGDDSSSYNVKIKLKHITIPGGWKRTKGSPNQRRSVDKQT